MKIQVTVVPSGEKPIVHNVEVTGETAKVSEILNVGGISLQEMKLTVLGYRVASLGTRLKDGDQIVLTGKVKGS